MPLVVCLRCFQQVYSSEFPVGTVGTRGLVVVVADTAAWKVAGVGVFVPDGVLWCLRILWVAERLWLFLGSCVRGVARWWLDLLMVVVRTLVL